MAIFQQNSILLFTQIHERQMHQHGITQVNFVVTVFLSFFFFFPNVKTNKEQYIQVFFSTPEKNNQCQDKSEDYRLPCSSLSWLYHLQKQYQL